MAVYRTIHISFWQDPFILELTPEEKYFYIYLMTNSKTNQLGCYEISKKVIEMETGYNNETVDKLINRFIDYRKILYCRDTKEMFLLNWYKYSWSKSPKVETCIKKELSNVKNQEFIQILTSLFIDYGYSIDSLGIKKEETKEKEEEKTYKEEKEFKSTPYQEIADLYNSICKSYPRLTKLSDARKKAIKARLNTYTIEDFKKLFIMAEESDFLKGKNDRNWSATFDWLIKDSNMAKVLDGNYKNSASQPTKSKPTNKFNQFPQREYTATDYKAIERALINKGLED
jgi:hypothetical protein